MQIHVQQLQSYLEKLPQRKLSSIALAAIVVYLAYLTAQLTWLLLDKKSSASASITSTNMQSGQTSQQGVNIKSIADSNLFGKANAEPKVEEVEPQVVSDAPETTLNIKLTGVVAVSRNDQAGLAIIESQGSQETYGINDVIKGTRAQLSQVLADRIIIKVSGRHETLMLDGMDFTKVVAGPARTSVLRENNDDRRVVEATSDSDSKSALQEVRAELAQDPGKIYEYLSLSPYNDRESGELVGYTLNPGKEPDMFKRMGLEPNDLALSINGYELSDPAQAMSVLSELREATSCTITLLRNGEQIDVVFSLE